MWVIVMSTLPKRACCYLDRMNLWASTVQCKPAKEKSSDNGPATSLMTKSTKDGEAEESLSSWNCIPTPHGGSSQFIRLGS